MKKIWKPVRGGIAGLLLLSLLLTGLSGCASVEQPVEKEKITVYLWNAQLLMEYAPYLKSQVPEAEIEFVVGNNDLDFYRFLQENGELPDIITNRRFSLYDAGKLQPYLLDLSQTETASSYYTTYLENYRNADGTVNWLPACGEVDGIVANKTLFDQYQIPLPTDYENFLSACEMFQKAGIQGFTSDFLRDYTCMEVLQGLSIPELTSLEGKLWRSAYESGEVRGLDDKIWPGVFARMEQFIQDAGITPEAAGDNYNDVKDAYLAGEVAMIRDTANGVYDYPGAGESVFLPYFGSTEEENWLLTYPSFHVALSKDLEKEAARKELALEILDAMLSKEGTSILVGGRGMIAYNRGIDLELAEEIQNLQTYIDANHLYIRLASNEFFSISKDVVQKLILGEYDAREAYDAFQSALQAPPAATPESVVTFETGYSFGFRPDGGNEACSAVANTLREAYGAELLLTPYTTATSSIFPTGYTEKQLNYLSMAGGSQVHAYTCMVTGAQVLELARCAVEDSGANMTPFDRSTLPVVSGFELQVEEMEQGFRLTGVTVGGKPLEVDKTYLFAYLDNMDNFEPARVFLDLACPEIGYEGFQASSQAVEQVWREYIMAGNPLAAPTDYMTLS